MPICPLPFQLTTLHRLNRYIPELMAQFAEVVEEGLLVLPVVARHLESVVSHLISVRGKVSFVAIANVVLYRNLVAPLWIWLSEELRDL